MTLATAAATASTWVTPHVLSICLIALAVIAVLCATLLHAIAVIVPQKSNHRLALLSEVLKYRRDTRLNETKSKSAP
ncbi:hypothetical protein NONI108955_37910 [Nocardia ninae]